MKIVINKCWGGFSISRKAAEYMAKLGNKQAAAELADWKKRNTTIKYFCKNGAWPKGTKKTDISMLELDAKYEKEAKFFGFGYTEKLDRYPRDNAELVKAVENLGQVASGEHSELKVIEIPDGTEYEIDDYDGMESVHEKHQTWY